MSSVSATNQALDREGQTASILPGRASAVHLTPPGVASAGKGESCSLRYGARAVVLIEPIPAALFRGISPREWSDQGAARVEISRGAEST